MKTLFSSLLIICIVGIFNAQNERKVAILNMSARNGDTGFSRTLSPIRILKLAGIPFDTTSNLTIAMDYPIIMTATRVKDGAFNSSEILSIENWVNNGGVLLTSNLREPDLENLCGISSVTSNDELYRITWDTLNHPQYFDLVDDSLEVTISLGRETSGPNFVTKYYGLSTGTAIATYEDGTAAMVKNQFGSGFVYTLGPDFRDISFRNRINGDINAHRSYSNGFEPSTDVFVFVIRNIIRSYITNTAYKYTVPHNYSSTVMITHDIDSRTSYDTMAPFALSEKNRGIIAQYNLTTNYIPGSWISDLYIGTTSKVQYVQNLGHTLASHSVGHFPDFSDESLFPYGTTGIDSSIYHPFYDGSSTSGGTVIGEVEVSKLLIDQDFSVNVKSWRSGHLQYPDSLNMALEETGYEFNSTYSANDVLTGFPFYATKRQSFSSEESSILEIPMTISDVFSSNPITLGNFMSKVDIWVDATRRYDKNNASTVLLIHPNRNYKLVAQESYLDSLPSTMKAYAFEDFGRFWRKRDSLKYHSVISNDTLYVQMDSEYSNEISFVIDTLALDSIVFIDMNGGALTFQNQEFGETQRLYFMEDPNADASINSNTSIDFNIYPNPTENNLNLSISDNNEETVISIFNIHGQLIWEKERNRNNIISIPVSDFDLKTGYYIIQLKTDTKISNKRFVFIRK